jgi:transcriptional regulator with GAF, ATPase, and Fis domain
MAEKFAAVDMELAETLGEVARALMAEGGLDATLDRVCTLAVETIKACESAGITLFQRGRSSSRLTTDERSSRLDDLQVETGEGPCVDAIRDHEVFRTSRLADEERWPKFAQRAYEETGVQSVLALRLYSGGDTMGALSLYSTEPDAFDDQDVAVGVVFATHASVAMSAARREGQFETKAVNRDAIGIAKGMLMAQSGVTADEAFEMLSHASQRMNVKVRDLAQQMAEGQRLDER